jgi:hypothetical protein
MNQSPEGRTAEELKVEVQKGVDLLRTLRDQIRVDIHLAGMEAKTRWQQQLEPRISKLEQMARKATKEARATIDQTVSDLKEFRESMKRSS